jgi:hypothetical protein
MWIRYLALACLLGGCNKTVPIQAKCVSMNREGAVFDVQTEPGVTASIEHAGQKTDDKGHATITVPLKNLLERSSKHLRTAYATVEGKKGLTEYYGHEEVKLPYTAEVATNIPAGASGAWMAITDSGTGSVFQLLKGDFGESSVRFSQGIGTLKLIGPPGAKIKIAGREVTLAADGTGEHAILREDLLARIDTKGLVRKSYGFEVKIPVEIEAGGAKKTGDLITDVSLHEHIKDLTAALTAGTPINKTPPAAGAKLLLAYESPYFVARGRDGTLDGVDLFAVETEANERPGPKCTGYGKGVLGTDGRAPDLERHYVDMQIKVYDTRSGKVVMDKTLEGGKAGCPSVVMGSKTIKDGPREADIHATLDTALKL